MVAFDSNSRAVEYLVRQRALEQDDRSCTVPNAVDSRLLGPVLRRLRAEHGATSPTSDAHLLFGDVNTRLAGNAADP
ncbi:hypothetical protein [Pseudaquabacterium terrae]|uniref:hypothetical protein n=1 Tax=Pseudaquabacterium terrae TaxID=2732868 RepID=UPI001FEC13A4|nr:hypothetical protein [Aquabacterium terrae]